MTTDPFSDPDLPQLVSKAMELQDQGLEPSVEEICSERPDLQEAVRSALDTSKHLASLQRDSAGHDGLLGRLIVGRYRLVRRVGSGAMGVVYEAKDEELQRQVAIKVLRSTLVAGHEAESRFEREAQALASMAHPAIVTIHDRGHTVDDDPFLVMELLPGCSLAELLLEAERLGQGASTSSQWIADRLDSGQLQESSYLRMVVRWTADLASGLATAHRAGVFHRDVKPSNVIIRPDGTPILLDFGIAAHIDHATITREGSALGTPAYMAPESLDPRPRPGPQLDVYGLAATLYHLLALQPPYDGTPSQILSTLADRECPRLAGLRPELPRDLLAVVERGMARRTAERYANATELEADLRAFLDYRPVTARYQSPLARTWRKVRRSPIFLTAVATLATTGLLLASRHWRQVRTEGLREQAAEIWAKVPASLTLVLPEYRAMADATERLQVEQVLDSALDLAVDPLPYRLVRACFRSDHGDSDGAADDMRRLARDLDTPLSKELAKRYGARNPDHAALDPFDLEALPDPVDDSDRYLLAYHLVRAGRKAEAAATLEAGDFGQLAYSKELHLQVVRNGLIALQDGTMELEAMLGRRTATTANLLAAALVVQGRFHEGQAICAEGLELAPQSIGLRTNAAVAAWRQGEHAKSVEWLSACIASAPRYLKPYKLLVSVLLDDGQYELASETLAAAPFGDSLEARAARSALQGDLETMWALQMSIDGDSEGSLQAAQQAVVAFDFASEHGAKLNKARRAYAKALAGRGLEQGLEELFNSLAESPLDWRVLSAATVRLEAVAARPTGSPTSNPSVPPSLIAYLKALVDYLRRDEPLQRAQGR